MPPAPLPRLAASLLLLLLAAATTTVAAVPDPIDFNRDVRPILAEHCLLCHGPDDAESGLALHRRELALAMPDSGHPAIAPGDPDASGLLDRVSASNPRDRMPPPDKPSLSEDEIAVLRQWIRQDAPWAEHWSLTPIERPEPPPVADRGWPRNPIDHFILAKLEAGDVAPSPEADRATLIKRLHYDLVGLPPTPAEVEEFIADDSPDAYDRLVDRLLDSPHFGERWGRHWLDKARYADSDGYEKDNARPDAWRWRDWVIDAFNRDLPVDRFTIEQLAGDLLPDATPLQHLATAFHRQTLTNREGGTDQEQFRVAATVDRANTTAAVWLGLTLGCAECHTHKYDDITHADYFQFYAFFNSADETEVRVPIAEEAVAGQELAELNHAMELLHDARYEVREALDDPAALALREQPLRQRIDSEGPLAFHPTAAAAMRATGEVALEWEVEAQSYLATGDNPATAKYTLEFPLDDLPPAAGPVTGLRIEALSDDRLPSRGPGRTDHGNFVLTSLRVYVSDHHGFELDQRVELDPLDASFSQSSYPFENALSDDGGWAVAPQLGRDHHADFTFRQPLPRRGDTDQPTWLQVVLDQQHGRRHTLGRFRVSLMTGGLLGVPEEIQQIVLLDPAERSSGQVERLINYFVDTDPDVVERERDVASRRQRRAELEQETTLAVRVLGQRRQPRTTRIHERGDFLRPGDQVTPGTPALLHPLQSRHGDPDALPDRLDLAHWLMDEANPLTPRVLANDLWRILFGRGLVETVEDFGVRGEPPSHPQLLDWLASEYRQLEWSRKAMIRTVVTSAAYRQTSAHRPELADRDPLNTLVARQNRFRVEAELVRDLTLAAGGLLEPRVGGPSVFPPMPADVAALSYAGNFRWQASEGADRYRRGMYTFFKRTAPHPNLTTFDCPDSNTTALRRMISNTPLQALTTLNEAGFVEAARAMADRLLTAEPAANGQPDAAADRDRLSHGFQIVTARPPQSHELEQLAGLLADARRHYADHRDQARRLVGDSELPLNADVSAEERAAWSVVSRVLLNLDEFLTRE